MAKVLGGSSVFRTPAPPAPTPKKECGFPLRFPFNPTPPPLKKRQTHIGLLYPTNHVEQPKNRVGADGIYTCVHANTSDGMHVQ